VPNELGRISIARLSVTSSQARKSGVKYSHHVKVFPRGQIIASAAILLALVFDSQGAAMASAAQTHKDVTFRAVLCFAPLFAAAASTTSIVTSAKCAPKYRLTAKNLDVNASVGTSKTIKPDPVFRDVPDSARTVTSSNGVFPGIAGVESHQRYVLGPVEMTSSGIKSAKVEYLSGQWSVSYTLTPSGGVTWNSFVKRQFHEVIAVVANGQVYSDPIILPDTSTFVSFGDSGLISGNLTKAEARQLASQM
jgi:hypothetical protein